MSSRTLFGVHYIHDRRGYSDSVRSLQVASYGQNGERQMRIPRFLYVVQQRITNHSGIWVSVGNMIVVD